MRDQIKTETLTGAAQDTMRCLFLHGPTWDGNVPSKAGRDQLVRLGLAERYNGWQWLNAAGAEIAIDTGMGDVKDRWERSRDRLTNASRDLLSAAKLGLNFIANTESEFGMTLESGDALRAAISKSEETR